MFDTESVYVWGGGVMCFLGRQRGGVMCFWVGHVGGGHSFFGVL